MKFAGMVKQSLVDYPGKVAATLFTRGCNLRCPFCHNEHLLIKSERYEAIELAYILEFLNERKGFLDGVVITGGEPTLNSQLYNAIIEIKKIGYPVKLDTNGTNSILLEQLLNDNLIDYIAMDIKAPIIYEKYIKACNSLTKKDFFNIRTSISILKKQNIEVEFKTTVVPEIHSPEDIVEIAKYIHGSKNYSLQQFNPQYTLDPRLNKLVPYSKKEMQEIANKCLAYIENVRVVNI
ncbi:Ribonucleotide reductase of class III (anaerobic), activating protein [Candidatus Syntrophocurvum alkaliphilum]|uniref:Ribonucleotide reductase of class III (Anaerobic), activating protein n=1 Tax=Candidatus Syntrophocurvum alkaliphilum TaxID=2293317 RepID=A0A6I6DE46_9FIRM|nr:anaerobic ribonucleoside-triphosphate reductase activating protein [Candidatus Syntrophocurvum alkaliphilum]QGU00825.1 Ribonucleotide reductase of class III (anaerobic), activating protein [Candidatus Syntrophocurvum alkaliphilum]